MRYFALITFLCISTIAYAQRSIHMEESQKYASLGVLSQPEYDSLNGFVLMDKKADTRGSLDKIVFGYHPFWGGSKYLNYQWDLLSDLSYFSYEVDPATGQASTIHDWLSSPAIDSAFAHDVRVHLCVTLFSGQSLFFNNPQSRQNLSNNLISLVKERGAHGVSLDFEAVPASQGENMLDYIAEFATQFHDSLPEGILSIAMPAVDWSGIFDVSILNQYIDLFMIMGYDYYWNGSSMAGPIDPQYNMTASYNYSVSRTVSYYQSEGMPNEKMLLGVPYYGREWPTATGTSPSSVTGYGTAYTWANIRNGASGNYSFENKKIDPTSFGVYFAYQSNGWWQCFVNDENSFHRRYRMVNQRGLAGIGIWALGYDNGFTNLWDVIASEFTGGPPLTIKDTIYDSGGPAWNYYHDEDYCLSYHGAEGELFQLEFTTFSLEEGYDSLWVYDGIFPGGTLLGGFSGSDIPPTLMASNTMSIRFRSDHNTASPGWRAVISGTQTSTSEAVVFNIPQVFPNPANDLLNIIVNSGGGVQNISLYDMHGKQVFTKTVPASQSHVKIDVSSFPAGVYLLSYSIPQAQQQLQKIIIR